ncbi:Sec-independent protein translocase protein TatB [Chitinibacter sp. SCUT-21]|uniref:Sec-independent protein translocase protein TatB n=1 Tax=Chitinibacter sp. SCUT-21 TaxID=2970891 RepID=UPI0035A6A52D
MFDVSIGELLLIGAVTLVVVGPEKMPKVARTAGMLFGRLQRFVNNVKVDLQREMQASELAQIQQEIEAEAAEIKNTIHQPLAETQQAMNQLEADFQATTQQRVSAEPDVTTANTSAAAPSSPAIVDDKQLDLFAGMDDATPTANSSDRR